MQPYSQIFHGDFVHLKYSSVETNLKGGGRGNGLIFKLMVNKDDIEPICEGFEQGFYVFVHAPDEYPNAAGNYFYVPLDSKYEIRLTPTIYNDNEDALKGFPLIERQCYVPGEKNLKYFKSYNSNNCKLECLMNNTLDQCNCARFFMPHDEDTVVCGTTDIECYRNETLYKDLSQCNCYPMCKSIEYDGESQYFLYNLTSFYAQYDALDTYTGTDKYSHHSVHINTIEIFFKNSVYLPLKRIELTGWSDFLANCGGLMGLFAGVSILTIVEIIYFCIFRCGGEYVTRKKEGPHLSNDFEMKL